ncbi:MAG TPA: hypothetical protein VIH16_06210 [Bellilinea sp.]
MAQDPLEILWDGLLSRDGDRIRATFAGLDETAQQFVLEHLVRMTREDGWQSEQVESARSALLALQGDKPGTE